MRTLASVDDSYELCRQVTASYAKNFYLGTQLMPEAKRRAIWAIYVWCRRTDELVDGPGSEATTPETLNLWEKRLESVFAGHPHDDYDVALVDTLSRFSDRYSTVSGDDCGPANGLVPQPLRNF